MTTGALRIASLGIGLALSACGGSQQLPASYSFTYRVSCFCPPADVTYRVVVEEGEVVSAVVDTVGPDVGPSVTPGTDFTDDPAALSLQDMIDSRDLSGDGTADRVDVTWPDGADHPTRIAVDRDLDAVDDEVGYEILSFTAD